MANFNQNEQEYKGVKIRLCTGFSYKTRHAMQFRIMDTVQKIWIPKCYLWEDGTLKNNVNLDFIFNNKQTKHKIYLAHIELHGAMNEDNEMDI